MRQVFIFLMFFISSFALADHDGTGGAVIMAGLLHVVAMRILKDLQKNWGGEDVITTGRSASFIMEN